MEGQEHSLCDSWSLQVSLHPPSCFLHLEDGFCLGELELCTHANDCSNSYRIFFIYEGQPAATLVEVLSGWLNISPSFSNTYVSARVSKVNVSNLNWQAGCKCPCRACLATGLAAYERHTVQLSHVLSKKCMKLHPRPSSHMLRSDRQVPFQLKFKMFTTSD